MNENIVGGHRVHIHCWTAMVCFVSFTQFLADCFNSLILNQIPTHREGRCCRRWAKTAALWCAVCRRGQELGVGLWRDPGLIFQRRGLRRGRWEDADRPRRKRRRNEREVAAASSAAPGTADAGAAGSAAACWWLYVQPGRREEQWPNNMSLNEVLGNKVVEI